MYSTQAWAAHYGLPLNAPEDFVQGYVDAMRLDAKGQGTPCGRGFISPNKKCSSKGRQQLASDLKAGDAKAKARVARGKQNAMAQQKARRQERMMALVDKKLSESKKQAEQQTQPKPKRSKPKLDIYGRTPKQQYKQAKGEVRRLKAMGVQGAPVRQAEAAVTKLEKEFNPMVPRKKRSPESIAKGKATRAKNKRAAEARRGATPKWGDFF